MKTGFFKNNCGYDAPYEAMEHVNLSHGYTAYDFLHGFCNCFAMMLNQKFGFPCELIWDECGCLIHAYCVNEVGGKKYFIDARGVTDDVFEFLDEFGDWLPSLEYPCPHMTYHEMFDDCTSGDVMESAKCLYEKYPEYYNF